MKKAIRSVLYVGEIIFCFLGIFDFTKYSADIGDAIMHKNNFNHSSLVYEIQTSFGADPFFEKVLDVFIWLFFIALAANVILSVLGLLKPELKIARKTEIVINVLPVLFFTIVSIIAILPHELFLETIYISYVYEINVLFIIFALIILANFILLFISFPESNGRKIQVSKKAQDVTEGLTYYKDLFDKGIITQEEYEAKKKQLLNL